MMRLNQLYDEWKLAKEPRPQTALEFKAALDDFIDFAGDIAAASIDADLLFDYRDQAAKLPAKMPRVDRALPFRARVEKHLESQPKCAASTLKKRIGALQALLTFAFDQRWIAVNAGVGIKIIGYGKKRIEVRPFEDHELARLCASPLFIHPGNWSQSSQVSDATMFWIFLLGITTGARLEEIGQAAVADVKRDGHISYLDIGEYVLDNEAASKNVKTDSSVRLVPIHAKLIELGFREYIDALVACGHIELFPDLKENSVGKRTKEASRKMNRIIDRHVIDDRRLVFHSTRHTFKAKGNDAGVNERTLDQICGHAPVSVGARYGSNPRIRTIYRELLRIDFSCIDWDRIAVGLRHVKWDAVVQAELYRREEGTPDRRTSG